MGLLLLCYGLHSAPNPTLADAILDRVVHNAYRIQLRGESMRKRQAISQSKKTNNTRSSKSTVTA